MASLSQVTDTTRKLLEYIGIGIAAIILLVIIFNIGKMVKEIISPTPPPPPTVAFGKLSPLTFPDTSSATPPTYTINTLTGALPDLPDRVAVYKLEQPQPNLLNLDKAKSLAYSAGFLDNPTALSDTLYRWTTTDKLTKSFSVDILSFDFLFSSSYLSDPTVQEATYLPDEDAAIKAATDFFAKISPLPTNLDPAKTKTTLFTITNGQLTPATSLSDAQIIRVDFFTQNIDKLPIYTSHPYESFIYALIASSDTTNPQVVEAQLYHKTITKDKATYPIKTAQQAYDALKSGHAFIASNPSNSPKITITNVSLGYYLDITSSDYLWPIIVFQGDKGFFAYVPAVKEDWVQK